MPESELEFEPGSVEVRLLPDPDAGPVSPSGPVGSAQEAELVVPAELLASLWRPAYLERLAAAYWRYLRRVSGGLIRIRYSNNSRCVVLLHRKLVLLRFREPVYDTGPGFGMVTWPIERGILVSSPGRGHLRITVRMIEGESPDGKERIKVCSEVENFFPLLRGKGWFARVGAYFYSFTQLRIHVFITHGFLRSLARLDLPPSTVGTLAEEDGEAEGSAEMRLEDESFKG